MIDPRANRDIGSVRSRRIERIRRRVEIVVALIFFGLLIRAAAGKNVHALVWSMVEIGPVLFGSAALAVMMQRAKRVGDDLAAFEPMVKPLVLVMCVVFCLMAMAVLGGITTVVASVCESGFNAFAATLAFGALYCASIMIRAGETLLRLIRLVNGSTQ